MFVSISLLCHCSAGFNLVASPWYGFFLCERDGQPRAVFWTVRRYLAAEAWEDVGAVRLLFTLYDSDHHHHHQHHHHAPLSSSSRLFSASSSSQVLAPNTGIYWHIELKWFLRVLSIALKKLSPAHHHKNLTIAQVLWGGRWWLREREWVWSKGYRPYKDFGPLTWPGLASTNWISVPCLCLRLSKHWAHGKQYRTSTATNVAHEPRIK